MDASVGLTMADFCMASTGTLVLGVKKGMGKSISLVPPVHAAILGLNQIILDTEELYCSIKDQSFQNMLFITGPSKTGDIEAVPVQGVHGPCEVYVYVVMDNFKNI